MLTVNNYKKKSNYNNNNQNKIKIYQKILYNRPYTFFKNFYNPVVPLKIYQTWYTKDLPVKMKHRVELLKHQNPKFEHCLFDDNDCREFIKTHFDNEVLNAFDSLIPGAYKADLWRLCILYINGGIYMDIKFSCVNGFKLIELVEKEHFVLDRLPPLSIYNALMVCKAGNPFLLDAIHTIVQNVKNKYYGSCALCPTGPIMLGNLIIKKKSPVNIDLTHFIDGGYIIYKNRFIISTTYNEYENERKDTYIKINTQRYDKLWSSRKIYK